MTEKLDIGLVFKNILEAYRAQAGLLLPAAFIVLVIPALINGIIAGGPASNVMTVLAIALGSIATYYYQGMVVEAVRDIRDGVRDFSLEGLFRSVLPVIAPLVAAGFLAGLGIAIGFVLLIIPGLVLSTFWALIAPVVVIERTGVIDAFQRSHELVRGNAWNVFGVIAALFIVNSLALALFRTLDLGVGGFGIAWFVVSALLLPLSGLAAAIMFFELKRIHGEETLGPRSASEPG